MPEAVTCNRSAYNGRNGITIPKPSRSMKTVANSTASLARPPCFAGRACRRRSTVGIDLIRAMKQILCKGSSQAHQQCGLVEAASRELAECALGRREHITHQ